MVRRIRPELHVTLPELLIMEVDRVARRRGISRSKVIEEALVKYLSDLRGVSESGSVSMSDPLLKKVLSLDGRGWVPV